MPTELVTYYYGCYGCGQRLKSDRARLRKCPQCGKLRLVQTGRVAVSPCSITIEKKVVAP